MVLTPFSLWLPRILQIAKRTLTRLIYRFKVTIMSTSQTLTTHTVNLRLSTEQGRGLKIIVVEAAVRVEVGAGSAPMSNLMMETSCAVDVLRKNQRKVSESCESLARRRPKTKQLSISKPISQVTSQIILYKAVKIWLAQFTASMISTLLLTIREMLPRLRGWKLKTLQLWWDSQKQKLAPTLNQWSLNRT